ncbi:MAG: hypothetical protein IJW82_05250, partial [Clostridia bacterium]|nr:hypothetical protein [Clostridia bacterium]
MEVVYYSLMLESQSQIYYMFMIVNEPVTVATPYFAKYYQGEVGEYYLLPFGETTGEYNNGLVYNDNICIRLDIMDNYELSTFKLYTEVDSVYYEVDSELLTYSYFEDEVLDERYYQINFKNGEDFVDYYKVVTNLKIYYKVIETTYSVGFKVVTYDEDLLQFVVDEQNTIGYSLVLSNENQYYNVDYTYTDYWYGTKLPTLKANTQIGLEISIPIMYNENRLIGIYFIPSTESEKYPLSFASGQSTNILEGVTLSYMETSKKTTEYDLMFNQNKDGFYFFYFDSDAYEVNLFVDNNGELAKTSSNPDVTLTNFSTPRDTNYVYTGATGNGLVKNSSYTKYSINTKTAILYMEFLPSERYYIDSDSVTFTILYSSGAKDYGTLESIYEGIYQISIEKALTNTKGTRTSYSIYVNFKVYTLNVDIALTGDPIEKEEKGTIYIDEANFIIEDTIEPSVYTVEKVSDYTNYKIKSIGLNTVIAFTVTYPLYGVGVDVDNLSSKITHSTAYECPLDDSYLCMDFEYVLTEKVDQSIQINFIYPEITVILNPNLGSRDYWNALDFTIFGFHKELKNGTYCLVSDSGKYEARDLLGAIPNGKYLDSQKTFLGWNTRSDNFGETLNDQSELVVANKDNTLTLYAIWGEGKGDYASPFMIRDSEDLVFYTKRINSGIKYTYYYQSTATQETVNIIVPYSYAYYEIDSSLEVLDLSGISSWEPIGNNATAFSGIFNGNNVLIDFGNTENKTKTPMHELTDSIRALGLFGKVLGTRDSAIVDAICRSDPDFNKDYDLVSVSQIKNIHISNVEVKANSYFTFNPSISILCGENMYGYIYNVLIDGNNKIDIEVNLSGGQSTKLDCELSVGGAIGKNIAGGLNKYSGMIKNVFTNTNIVCKMNGASLQLNVGGIVGQNMGDISQSANIGDILVETNFDTLNETDFYESKNYIGGIAGYNEKTISNVFVDNDITVTNGGKLYLGGIVGFAQTGMVNIAYSNTRMSVYKLSGPSEFNPSLYLGGLAGYTVVKVTNSIFGGTIEIDKNYDLNSTSYIGGGIGYKQTISSQDFLNTYYIANINNYMATIDSVGNNNNISLAITTNYLHEVENVVNAIINSTMDNIGQVYLYKDNGNVQFAGYTFAVSKVENQDFTQESSSFNLYKYYFDNTQKYTVTLYMNGGRFKNNLMMGYSYVDESVYTKSVVENSVLGALPIPTKSGQDFIAWCDKDGNKIYDCLTTNKNYDLYSYILMNEDIELYAEWTDSHYIGFMFPNVSEFRISINEWKADNGESKLVRVDYHFDYAFTNTFMLKWSEDNNYRVEYPNFTLLVQYVEGFGDVIVAKFKMSKDQTLQDIFVEGTEDFDGLPIVAKHGYVYDYWYKIYELSNGENIYTGRYDKVTNTNPILENYYADEKIQQGDIVQMYAPRLQRVLVINYELDEETLIKEFEREITECTNDDGDQFVYQTLKRIQKDFYVDYTHYTFADYDQIHFSFDEFVDVLGDYQYLVYKIPYGQESSTIKFPNSTGHFAKYGYDFAGWKIFNGMEYEYFYLNSQEDMERLQNMTFDELLAENNAPYPELIAFYTPKKVTVKFMVYREGINFPDGESALYKTGVTEITVQLDFGTDLLPDDYDPEGYSAFYQTLVSGINLTPTYYGTQHFIRYVEIDSNDNTRTVDFGYSYSEGYFKYCSQFYTYKVDRYIAENEANGQPSMVLFATYDDNDVRFVMNYYVNNLLYAQVGAWNNEPMNTLIYENNHNSDPYDINYSAWVVAKNGNVPSELSYTSKYYLAHASYNYANSMDLLNFDTNGLGGYDYLTTYNINGSIYNQYNFDLYLFEYNKKAKVTFDYGDLVDGKTTETAYVIPTGYITSENTENTYTKNGVVCINDYWVDADYEKYSQILTPKTNKLHYWYVMTDNVYDYETQEERNTGFGRPDYVIKEVTRSIKDFQYTGIINTYNYSYVSNNLNPNSSGTTDYIVKKYEQVYHGGVNGFTDIITIPLDKAQNLVDSLVLELRTLVGGVDYEEIEIFYTNTKNENLSITVPVVSRYPIDMFWSEATKYQIESEIYALRLDGSQFYYFVWQTDSNDVTLDEYNNEYLSLYGEYFTSLNEDKIYYYSSTDTEQIKDRETLTYADLYVSSILVATRKQSYNVIVHADIPIEDGSSENVNTGMFELNEFDISTASASVTEVVSSLNTRVFEDTTVGTMLKRLVVKDKIVASNERFIASLGTNANNYDYERYNLTKANHFVSGYTFKRNFDVLDENEYLQPYFISVEDIYSESAKLNESVFEWVGLTKNPIINIYTVWERNTIDISIEMGVNYNDINVANVSGYNTGIDPSLDGEEAYLNVVSHTTNIKGEETTLYNKWTLEGNYIAGYDENGAYKAYRTFDETFNTYKETYVYTLQKDPDTQRTNARFGRALDCLPRPDYSGESKYFSILGNNVAVRNIYLLNEADEISYHDSIVLKRGDTYEIGLYIIKGAVVTETEGTEETETTLNQNNGYVTVDWKSKLTDEMVGDQTHITLIPVWVKRSFTMTLDITGYLHTEHDDDNDGEIDRTETTPQNYNTTNFENTSGLEDVWSSNGWLPVESSALIGEDGEPLLDENGFKIYTKLYTTLRYGQRINEFPKFITIYTYEEDTNIVKSRIGMSSRVYDN